MRLGRRSAALAGVSLAVALVAAGLILPGASGRSGALTPAERAAMRIVSVDAVGAEGGGMVVRVTFGGNLQKLIGRGNLKNALVAMILRPKDPSFATADLATEGPGSIGVTSKKTRSESVGVIRNGKVFTFFIAGAGSSNVKEAKVKTFVAAPGRKPARRTSGVRVSPDQWEQIENQIATDEFSTLINEIISDSKDCDELRRIYNSVLEDLARVRVRKTELQDLRKQIDAQIEQAAAKAGTKKPTPKALKPFKAALDATLLAFGGARSDGLLTWGDVLRNLKLDRRLVDEYSNLNDKLYERLLVLKGKLEALHKERCNQPGTAPTPTKTFGVGVKTSYMHNGDTSNVCIRVTTSPAQPSAAAQIKTTGPGVLKNGEQSKQLDASGQSLADVQINVRGLYTVTATVTAHGETETATVTQDVKVAQATCPPAA